MNQFQKLLVLSLTFTLIHCGSSDLPTLGGKVSGLNGTLVLENNFGDELTITKNGTFSFKNRILFNSPYKITVKKQPSDQTCSLEKGEGHTNTSNITDVKIICTDTSSKNPETTALIATNLSTLGIVANGPAGTITITNNSTQVTATNIASDFSGTALDGKVTETGNTCASLAPGASCFLAFTPGSSAVTQTDFPIAGTNTNTIVVSLTISPPSTLTTITSSSGSTSGGVGFTLMGTNLTGASDITFGGFAATSINVINSTTVTGVTPAHAAGVVSVFIATPAGGATINNGYTYVATAIAQPSNGGTIACLNSGLNNLIAATADNSSSIEWGTTGTSTGAQSDTDGGANTATIVSTLGSNGGTPYASQNCTDYEIDSQGNTPCETGNTCYSDWFLPATNQLSCLYTNKVAIGGFSGTSYWTSTESTSSPTIGARIVDFTTGATSYIFKDNPSRLRCVRAFTP